MDVKRTIVEFTLPFAAIDEGKYNIKLGKNTAVVIIKFIPNPCGLKEVMKMKVEDATFELDSDIYGIANMSNVMIELPYERNDYNYTDHVEGHHIPSYSLKKDCVLYLNRLIDALRFETRRHWIP